MKKVRSRYKRDPESIQLKEKAEAELEDFVTVISHLYRDNPFHNFEHASTVLSSVNKVVSLADAPDDIDYTDIRFITTDPWTHFALVFSALIHDVDHAGVPNAQLIKEGAHVAHAYKNKSVAEQNSLEISWSLLMEPCYRNLRETLFVNSEELMHFRSLVVTATLATDIADKELAAMRKDRAADALAAMDEEAPTSDDIASRKATFVLETLIQVADVSHLMMPFPMYKKWNYRLLRETHKGFLAGRAETDPIENWYKGEFGFFDFYIIPLAKKLDKCGIDSTTYVENATNNRKMWEEVGEELVSGFKKELESAIGSVHSSSSESAFTKDESSSEESSFNSSGFASFSDLESDSDEEEKANTSAILRTPEKTNISSSSVKGRIKAIQKEKAEEYNGKLRKTAKGNHLFSTAKQTKNGISPSKKADDKSPKAAGNPVRRLANKKSKVSSSYNEESKMNDKKKATGDKRIGRTKTAIPPGELRYKQRSKSASSEPKVVEVSSDNENKKSVKSSNKKKKKTRSRSLDNSIHKNTMKGKRPGKAKAKSSLD